MLSLMFVLRRSKNFTSNVAIRMPPVIPINHYLGVLKTNKIEPRSYSIIPCTKYSNAHCGPWRNIQDHSCLRAGCINTYITLYVRI